MMFREMKTIALAAALASLSACAVGPDYVRPSVDAPAQYKETGNWKVAQPRDDANRGKWWEIFGDPQLNALTEGIDISNQSLAAAAARFRQAQALVAAARAGLFPTVDGNLSITRSRSPSGAVGGTTAGRIVTTRAAGVSANWDTDLWGRLDRTLEADVASAQASAADLAAVRLSAQTELAQNYFQLRVLDVQRQLLEDTVAAFGKSLQLTKNRYAAGVVGKVDVVQAETQLKSTQAQAIDIGVQRAQFEHAIALLIGKPSSEFAIERRPLTVVMPAIPPGLPSDLLERRPDIAAAERRVAAANAQIGAAQAAFFPSLTLSATAGFRTSEPSLWFTTPSRFWSLGPAIAQSIFDAGLRRAQTDQAIAAYDANVAAYRQTVLTGFKEVEDNLAALRILEEEARVQDEAVKAARESLALTTNQYKAGTISYLNVVIVQAAQVSNERAAVSILGQRLTAAVLLVKALGGGWQTPGAGMAATGQP
jgi:NodT family efflux transporter outer membrane factor (OMF) lipoprotein